MTRAHLKNGKKAVLSGIAFLLLACGIWMGAGAGLSLGKAWLAPILIEKAWARARAGETGDALKPWPWADTEPAARLIFPTLGRDRIVLDGATGRSMAFGPVLDTGGDTPVVFGHRDTHFRVLEQLKRGDTFFWEDRQGIQRPYRVRDLAVMDFRKITLPPDPDKRNLALVTCYPFDAIQAGGPLRYVVLAELIQDKPSTS